MPGVVDIAVVGAGAAGLMGAICAGRTARDAGRPMTVVALDGARTLGAKILVAGGGRCNVTHHAVDETAFAGSTRPAIRKVLGRFGVDRTVEFFQELGVTLKREDTGKLFPTTDNSHTVLSALLRGAADADVQIRFPWRVGSIERSEGGFLISPAQGNPEGASRAASPIIARRVILAAGGKALPRSGSDGAAYAFATGLGHTLTPRIFPALVPLTLPKDHFICSLSGIAVPATLTVRAQEPRGRRKPLAQFTGPTLLTHFGISGPAALDISRYYLAAAVAESNTTLSINLLPHLTTGTVDDRLQRAGREEGALTVLGFLSSLLPERLAGALCAHAGVDASTRLSNLAGAARRQLALVATDMVLPIIGDRGFTHAEVTAGGVPLSEVHLDTMESRVCAGLHICGEILDVDGRIGGFNFQWAWASGFVAGSAAARGLVDRGDSAPGLPAAGGPSTT